MRRKANEATVAWDFNVTKTLEGIYLRKEVVDSKFGKENNKYIIETPDHVIVGLFGSATLDRQFKAVPEGAYVWVTFNGKRDLGGGKSLNLYDVEFDDEFAE